MSASPEEIQAEYYAATATEYDAMHDGDAEHARALQLISALIEPLGISSLLDVGTGTGRALLDLAPKHPELRLHGIEPVPALIERAQLAGVPADRISEGRGNELPFEDRSFDAVCAFGVMHHVADPGAVLAEMRRVARRAVFVSDGNRFGQRSVASGALKLALYRVGLWKLVDRLRTRGRGYQLSDDDGLYYSYSLYDNLRDFADWDTQLIATGDSARPNSIFHPLLTCQHLLLCAYRTS